MTATDETLGHSESKRRIDGVTPQDRTQVIVMSQVVVIVALLVLWAILRARRTGRDCEA